MSGEMTTREKISDILYTVPSLLFVIAVAYGFHLCLNDYSLRAIKLAG